MKITQIASKPQLVKFTLDGEDIVKQFGEPIDFWSWDRQPMDVFMQLAGATESDTIKIITICKDLILDDAGMPVLKDGVMLPTSVMMSAIAAITERLGK